MEALFDSFLQFDLSVFQWIQSIQNGFLNAVMVGITTLGNAGAVFIVLGLVLLFTKKYRKAGLAVLVALLVMLLCSDLFLKEFFARVRPFNLFESNPEKYAFWGEKYVYPELVSKPTSFSFPSGHTASAFAAAVALLWHNRKLGIPTIIFATIMGFSRIYVQVHYCTDVFGGIVAGTICALIAVLIVRFLFPVVDKGFNKLSEKVKSRAKKE
ncbi:MAG: phosphatase PAP2 family protein [Clostridia bacterium]|nr:phosphatase PAP2 family protein [Clostridia bacterium]